MRKVIGCFCCLVALGCSSEVARYPISGSVSINGVPAGLATVKFIADGKTNKEYGGSCLSDGTGKFVIGSNDKNLGLPEGDYKVTFSQSVGKDGKPIYGSGGKKSEVIGGEREAVPDIFRNPDTTPISAHVGRSGNDFKFEIFSK
jgi:hypothetical protein